jgi:putative ABC transport system ATP-binding protein
MSAAALDVDALATNATAAVELTNLSFAWKHSEPVLAIRRFAVARNERVFLQGPSGSGKSTLLAIVGGVLTPDAGQVVVLGSDLKALSAAKRDAFRADHVGFIFQMFNLLPYLSIVDNVVLPCRFSARRRQAALRHGAGVAQEAERLLAHLGLTDRRLLNRRVDQLSIGQQQRVAAARALIGRPELVIADEPTSSLDADARDDFIELLLQEADAAGAAVIFVSHDRSLGERFDRSVALGEINDH